MPNSHAATHGQHTYAAFCRLPKGLGTHRKLFSPSPHQPPSDGALPPSPALSGSQIGAGSRAHGAPVAWRSTRGGSIGFELNRSILSFLLIRHPLMLTRHHTETRAHTNRPCLWSGHSSFNKVPTRMSLAAWKVTYANLATQQLSEVGGAFTARVLSVTWAVCSEGPHAGFHALSPS